MWNDRTTIIKTVLDLSNTQAVSTDDLLRQLDNFGP